MLILLPPSETKSAPGRGRPLSLDALSSPGLAAARGEVLTALVSLCGEDPAKAAEVLGLGTTRLDLVERNAALRTAATARAERVYTGVLYDALDAPGLDASARRRLQRVQVASSLLGIVRLSDRIPAYRLSGDATLPGLGAVAAHWRAHLGPAIRDAVGTGLFIDLRSGMYAAFWRPKGTDLAPRTVSLRVLHEHDGTRKVVSHFNKATKGRIVRDLLTDGGTPRTVDGFAEQLRDLGWSVERHASGPQGTQLDVVVTQI